MSEVFNPRSQMHTLYVAQVRREFVRICKVQCTATSQQIMDATEKSDDDVVEHVVPKLAELQGVKIPPRLPPAVPRD